MVRKTALIKIYDTLGLVSGTDIRINRGKASHFIFELG